MRIVQVTEVVDAGSQEACLEMGQCVGCWGPAVLLGVTEMPCSRYTVLSGPASRRGNGTAGFVSRTFPDTSVQGLCPLLSGSFPLYLASFFHVV